MRGIFISEEALRLVDGRVNQALLLSQISYWSCRAKVKIGGVLWVAKTYKEWSRELGVSVKQFKGAYSALRHRGLIQTTRARFNGLVTAHVRLTTRARGALIKKPESPRVGSETPPEGLYSSPSYSDPSRVVGGSQLRLFDWPHNPSKGTNRLAPKGTNRLVPKGTNPYTESTTDSTSKEIRKQKGKFYGVNEGTEMKVAESVKGVSGKQEPVEKLIAKTRSVPSLQKVWKRVYADHYPDGFIRTWNGRERAQAKYLLSVCPEEVVGDLVVHCLSDWGAFSAYVSTHVPDSFCTTPHILFLATHISEAIDWHATTTQLKPELTGLKTASLQKESVKTEDPASKISEVELLSVLGWDTE